MKAEQPKEKVFVKTFGCQMNVYDSDRMTETLLTAGYSATDDIKDAELVILNTCHIREKATEKVYSELGRVHEIKKDRLKDGKKTLIAVAGCVAQAEGAEIFRRSKTVDIVVGPQSYQTLPRLISQVKSTGARIQELNFLHEDKFTHLSQQRKSISPSAFLTIQEGCDKFCSFCVVPYTRGIEYSRSIRDLEREALVLIDKGVSELILLGQNVNAYHGLGEDGKPASLADLLSRLSRIKGLERLRYTTSHPLDMSEDLILAHQLESKVMPYLHLPFQSGSDKILRNMNRRHTALDYYKIVERIRLARPDIALSTDIIVGFPGETDEDFENTIQLVTLIGFAQSYCFKYSPRPGTPSANSECQVAEDVKSERLARLQNILQLQHETYNAQFVGKTLPVLFEKEASIKGVYLGRSPYFQLVQAEVPMNHDSVLGRILPVEILKSGPGSLTGCLNAS